jgi:hypothetical protein
MDTDVGNICPPPEKTGVPTLNMNPLEMSPAELGAMMSNPLYRRQVRASLEATQEKVAKIENVSSHLFEKGPREKVYCDLCHCWISKSGWAVHKGRRKHVEREQIISNYREMLFGPSKKSHPLTKSTTSRQNGRPRNFSESERRPDAACAEGL